MKSFPTLTIYTLALVAVAWLSGASRLIHLPLQADDDAQPSTTPADTPDSSTQSNGQSQAQAALTLLQDARHRLLHERQSVQAKLRETVSMGPRKFRGQGTYIAGQFPKLRLELAIDVGSTQGELLEVCDGTILWTVQQIVTPQTQTPDIQVARTVISDVIEAQELTTDVAETYVILGMGVGGLPALLAGLERSMTFEAMRSIEEEGRKFTVIQGRWNDEFLNKLTGGKDSFQLPSFMPDHVRIYFEDQTLFPTRILYLRRTEPEATTFVALLSLEFSDVVLDGPVNDELFQYTPGPNVKVRDRTGDYLKMIDETAEKTRDADGVRPDGSVPVDRK